MNAVDTNILLYSVDRHEPAKRNKAQRLLQHLHVAEDATVLPWQVLGELGQQLRRWRERGKLTPAEFVQHVQVFRHLFPLLMPTSAVFDQAMVLAEHHSLAHWDSMLVAACQTSGIGTLYTEDMGAPRTIDGVQLVNPLI